MSSLEGWTDVATPPDWATLVNQGWYQFSWDAEYIYAMQTVTTAAGTVSYVIPGGLQWKRVLDVVWDTAGTPLPVNHSTEDYERYLRADWRTQSSGVPVRYTFSSPGMLSLIPPPNAVKSVSVRGIVQGSAMTADSDLPGQVGGVGTAIPDVFHEAIAIYACYLHGKAYAQGEARGRLQSYLEDYQRYVEDARIHGEPLRVGS